MEEKILLYHYTSLNTFWNILNGMEDSHIHLRAGNSQKMNDSSECLYFLKSIRNIAELTEQDLNKIIETKQEFDNAYIISFSDKENDLHMWTCYGDDAKGIAISFDKEKLVQSLSRYSFPMRLYKCRYGNCEEIYEKIGSPNAETLRAEGEKDAIPYYYRFSDLVKHPSFEYEHEWRLVMLKGKDEPVLGNSRNFYNSDADAFFIPISIDCIESIYVGPSEEDVETITEKIATYLPNVTINKSEIPYRSKENINTTTNNQNKS